MAKTFVEQFVSNPAHMRIYQQERAIYEVTELIEAVMEAEGVSRAELAKMLGKSKSWVTHLLDGEANKTIRTVPDVLPFSDESIGALDHRSISGTIH